jgi:hypothetical protein
VGLALLKVNFLMKFFKEVGYHAKIAVPWYLQTVTEFNRHQV